MMDNPQRYRLTFAKCEEVKYISHLDLMRLLERAMRRADLPLDYSSGFNPRPKISIAVPLAVGVTGTAEFMDVTLVHPVEPEEITGRLNATLPTGVAVGGARPVRLDEPSLQSLVTEATYDVTVFAGVAEAEVMVRIDGLLAADSLPRERKRAGGIRRYDLRPLIHQITIQGVEEGRIYLRMRLEASSLGSGRPEEVVSALDLPAVPIAINRSALIFSARASGEEEP